MPKKDTYRRFEIHSSYRWMCVNTLNGQPKKRAPAGPSPPAVVAVPPLTFQQQQQQRRRQRRQPAAGGRRRLPPAAGRVPGRALTSVSACSWLSWTQTPINLQHTEAEIRHVLAQWQEARQGGTGHDTGPPS